MVPSPAAPTRSDVRGDAVWSLVCGYESMTNGVTYQEVNGVLDQSMTLDAASRFAAPGAWQVMAGYVMGINLTAARINAPSMRSLILPEIYPSSPVADVPTIGVGPIIMERYGPRFAPQEYFIVEISRGGADAQPVMWGLWIGPDITAPALGPAYTAVATASPTIVAGSWVLASLSFNQTLPAGRYQVIGLGVVCNDCTFARLVFPGLSQYRPGVVVQDAYGDFPWGQRFRYGGMGSFGEFVHNAPPAMEFLGDTAGAESAVVYLDLIKVA